MYGFSHRLIIFFSSLLLAYGLLLAGTGHAEPALFEGQWFLAETKPVALNQASSSNILNRIASNSLTPITRPSLTGGTFVFSSVFNVEQAGQYVIDFKNTSTIALFRHTVLDAQGKPVQVLQGGIQSNEENPYPFRHARDIQLTAGKYTLISEVSTPFLIAQPQPYLDTRKHYEYSIRSSNALTLLCLGVLIGLGVYYLSLSVARHRSTESMYALFILGNLLYNGTAGLVFADMLDWHWFYLATVPILFSNMAYILFVKSLLDIRHTTCPRLHRLGQAALAVQAGFALFSLIAPNWSMEMCRYGVGIFLVYGLLCGSCLSLKGNTSARFYLIAILAFCALGFVSISLSDVTGQYTLHVEHLGLLSVTIEATLLALVLSYQFNQLHHEKEHALSRLETSQILAMTDSLTGLPNRYSLEIAIDALPAEGSLTFLDLDGLKYYNDHFGHARGDALLRDLSIALQGRLGDKATLHRLGGDEFAVTCPTGDQSFVESMLAETVVHLRSQGFEFAGFSLGTVHAYETAGNHNKLMHMADSRMYENKRQRKKHLTSAANLAGAPD